MERTKYIVVEGPIGVGKTSLAKMLAHEFQARTVFERVEDNPFLPKFYKSREIYAFQNQTFFLLNRYQQQMELAQQDLFEQNTVADYLFAKDQIFASLDAERRGTQPLSANLRAIEHPGAETGSGRLSASSSRGALQKSQKKG